MPPVTILKRSSCESKFPLGCGGYNRVGTDDGKRSHFLHPLEDDYITGVSTISLLNQEGIVNCSVQEGEVEICALLNLYRDFLV